MQWLTIIFTILLIPPLTLITALFWARQQLSTIYSSASTPTNIILTQTPNSISALTILSTFLQIISKYIPTLWTAPPALTLHDNGKDFALPHILLNGPIKLSAKDEAAFRRAVSLSTPAPYTSSSNDDLNLLFLPCLTGPILPLLLCQRHCPIRPLGAVNTRNTFTILRPDLVRDISALHKLNLSFRASFGGQLQPGLRRKRGVEFSIEIDILATTIPAKLTTKSASTDASNSVGETILIKQKCWFLQFLPRSTKPQWDPVNDATSDQAPPPLASTVASTETQALSLTPSHPRHWAACCKDYNPIHVSWLGARVFGFPSVIVHGNHAVALALELARANAQDTGVDGDGGRVLDTAREMLWHEKQRGVEIEVRFLRPLVLPAKVDVVWSAKGGKGVDFVVGRGGKVFTTAECRYV